MGVMKLFVISLLLLTAEAYGAGRSSGLMYGYGYGTSSGGYGGGSIESSSYGYGYGTSSGRYGGGSIESSSYGGSIESATPEPPEPRIPPIDLCLQASC